MLELFISQLLITFLETDISSNKILNYGNRKFFYNTVYDTPFFLFLRLSF